ncbi:MAG: glycosyltransferase family 4 protein [Gemmatimonadota bacterium]
MRIAVEAARLVKEHRGIGRYVRNLLPALARLDPDLHFIIYSRPGDTATARHELDRLGLDATRTTTRPLSRLGRDAFDLFWSPWNYTKYLPRTGPIAVTMHDVVPLLFPDRRWRRRLTQRKVERRFRDMAAAASVVLTNSHFTRREVERCLGVAADRIRVTLLGADDFAPGDAAAAASLVRGLGVVTPFVLYVGADEERKNLSRLVRAFALLRQRLHVDCCLVIAGPGESLRRSQIELLDETHVGGAVRYVGMVSDAELKALYRSATAFVFPSLYEGFGLPVLEAMASGTPVVTSNAASLPEVAGDAALYFDPLNVEELADQLARVLTDEQLRRTLVDRGLEQAARFRWAETAEGTLEAFRETASGH